MLAHQRRTSDVEVADGTDDADLHALTAVQVDVTNTGGAGKCTYDVYDKEGNKTRANCVAENKLPADQIVAGLNKRTTLTLMVNPTYLYVLSDPDLDNPTVVIN